MHIQDAAPGTVPGRLSFGMVLPLLFHILRKIEDVVDPAPKIASQGAVRLEDPVPGFLYLILRILIYAKEL